MKSPLVFSLVLFNITACVFAWQAQTTAGMVCGHICVIVSTAFLIKTVLSAMFPPSSKRIAMFLDMV